MRFWRIKEDEEEELMMISQFEMTIVNSNMNAILAHIFNNQMNIRENHFISF